MSRTPLFVIVLSALALHAHVPAVRAGEHASPAAVAAPRATANPMHPLFVVRDAEGRSVKSSGAAPSVERTCGSCHDAEYIAAHDQHANERVHATCVDCHAAKGAWPPAPASLDAEGRIPREAALLSSPKNENCAGCHQVVHAGGGPVRIPADFEAPGDAWAARAFTRNTGSIFSPETPAASDLNLKDKAAQAYPWDVHAQRFVQCVDCHYAANDPTRGDQRRSKLDFVVRDPRRIGLADFLHRPDHRLAAAPCRSCHDPLKTHAFLPYRERHLAVLDCRACHIPRALGPAARTVDETVLRADGSPVVTYRGMTRPEGVSLDAAFLAGYEPLLLMQRDSTDATGRLAPYNAVDRWFWLSAVDGKPLPAELVRRAYLEQGRFAPQVLAAFDANHDGALQDGELRLDTAAKSDVVRARLRELGAREPEVGHAVTLVPLAHGVVSGAQVQRECASCHTRDSRLQGRLELSDFTPVGAPPAGPGTIEGPRGSAGATLHAGTGGAYLEARIPDDAPVFVFGHSRRAWVGRLGFTLFLAIVLAVSAHATFRLLSRRPHPAPAATKRVRLYSLYERGWHWLMAMSILALMLTGLRIEYAGQVGGMAFPLAVAVHNFFAVVLTANAFLSLFYHLSTRAIRQFIPPKAGLAQQVAAQANYYVRGIFLGQPHPSPQSAARKLNPLQQLTYLALLNVLFPVQVVTGILIWGLSRWPRLADAIGGLSVIAPVHDLGAWLFLTFFVLHVYLTTTGHTVFAHVSSMLDGYGDVETESRPSIGGSRA
jgi:thiosulfate reductase cytochrome b subunit